MVMASPILTCFEGESFLWSYPVEIGINFSVLYIYICKSLSYNFTRLEYELV